MLNWILIIANGDCISNLKCKYVGYCNKDETRMIIHMQLTLNKRQSMLATTLGGELQKITEVLLKELCIMYWIRESKLWECFGTYLFWIPFLGFKPTFVFLHNPCLRNYLLGCFCDEILSHLLTYFWSEQRHPQFTYGAYFQRWNSVLNGMKKWYKSFYSFIITNSIF